MRERAELASKAQRAVSRKKKRKKRKGKGTKMRWEMKSQERTTASKSTMMRINDKEFLKNKLLLFIMIVCNNKANCGMV